MSSHVGVEKQTVVLCKSSKCPQLLSLISSASCFDFETSYSIAEASIQLTVIQADPILAKILLPHSLGALELHLRATIYGKTIFNTRDT